MGVRENQVVTRGMQRLMEPPVQPLTIEDMNRSARARRFAFKLGGARLAADLLTGEASPGWIAAIDCVLEGWVELPKPAQTQ